MQATKERNKTLTTVPRVLVSQEEKPVIIECEVPKSIKRNKKTEKKEKQERKVFKLFPTLTLAPVSYI